MSADRRPRSPDRHRAVRGAHGGDDGVGDPRAVRRGQPARGRLARRRHAQPRRAAAGRAGRRGRRPRRPRRARSRCSTARRRARPELREQICEVMALEGIRADPDDVVVTVGSQMALDLVTRIFCDPGDVVLAEGPSYVGALGSFAAYQAQVVHVAMDAHGLVPDAAAGGARGRSAAGGGPKFLYTIPNFHNPAGVTLAVDAAGRGARDLRASTASPSSRTTRTGCSGFDGQTYPALRSLDPRRRLPRARSPRRSPPGCGSAGRSRRTRCATSWCWPPSRRRSARRASPRCWSRATWRRTTGAARSRRSPRPTASAATPCSRALETYLPAGCTWNVPDGGFYVWLTVPEGVDTKAMLPARGHGAGRLRVRHRVLRRRARQPPAAAVVLLPDAGADHRGRAPAGGGAGGGARRAAHVRQPGRPRRRPGPQAPSPDTP